METANNTTDKRLLAKVSSMYYEQGFNQQEIANRLHLSRPKISRLLKKARKEGVVQISVVKPEGNFLTLEQSIEKKFSLTEVMVVESESDISSELIKRQVGIAAGQYLHRTIANGDTIGVTWGTTLQAMVDAMTPKKIDNTHVVQALGGVGPPEAKAHATDISRRLSQLLNSQLTLLPAPGIVGSVESKQVLLADRQVRGALDQFSEIDILCVGLGALETNPVLDRDSQELPPHLYDEMINSNAVGDIALRFFDLDGQETNSSLKDLVIGISMEELKKVNNVVGVAGGPEKIDVIRGALNGQLIDVLITDSQVAQILIEDS
jgi:DNA-binding transcriptional regulator LsrR (DeoR family)